MQTAKHVTGCYRQACFSHQPLLQPVVTSLLTSSTCETGLEKNLKCEPRNSSFCSVTNMIHSLVAQVFCSSIVLSASLHSSPVVIQPQRLFLSCMLSKLGYFQNLLRAVFSGAHERLAAIWHSLSIPHVLFL